MKKKSNLFVVIFAWLFAFLAVGAVLAVWTWNYAVKPADAVNPKTLSLHVPSGMSVREVSDILENKEIIHSWLFLYLAARYNVFSDGDVFTLKSGDYELSSAMPLKEIMATLQTGLTENIKVSIPEGLTMRKTATLVEEAGICDSTRFLECCVSRKLLNEYHISAENLEGYLFPDTYFFTENMEPEAVVRIFLDTFFEKLGSIAALNNVSREKLHEIVILASIVEREYRDPEDAPMIASVFVNRLEHKIGLESCATIEYILTEIEGKPHPKRITYQDLESDNPYNTYKWRGLPPGPIANPGLVALAAAAEPAKTDYYYFVLSNKADGKHTFTKSLEEHNKAKNLYLKDAPARR